MIGSLKDFKFLYPRGDLAYILKEDDEAESRGGILIPELHQEYRRRGWCLVPGGGTKFGDEVVPNQFQCGDYLVCDRHFSRPDEREDEITREEIDGRMVVTCIIRGDEVLAFIPAKQRPAPEWARKIIERFSSQP